MKILLADDDAPVRQVTGRILGKWGYDVVAAENGTEAFEILTHDHECRLALLDWVMPGLEGPQVCELIQDLGRFVYAILLTGRGTHEDLPHALAAGASDYLTKPFDPIELRARLKAGERILNLQRQLVNAQKLESIGRLASGIAHEINTPIQFVRDNLAFLEESLQEFSKPWELLASILEEGGNDPPEASAFAELRSAFSEAELSDLMEEIPTAIRQSLEGADRVARIVSSMKEFAHPSSGVREAVDLAHAIETTLTVARNEWKYVADVETSFDASLPPVCCLPDELNQVILLLIVNAAQAIGEKNSSQGRPEEEKGHIEVSTKRDGAWAEIRVSDTGTGILPEIQDKIFDPFFTTKPVGKGTGQGLAIAHSVIVEKHRGTIEVESQIGVGATFVVRIPIDPKLC